jgi:hypothetical protein
MVAFAESWRWCGSSRFAVDMFMLVEARVWRAEGPGGDRGIA